MSEGINTSERPNRKDISGSPLGSVALEAVNGHIDAENVDTDNNNVQLDVIGDENLPDLYTDPNIYPSVAFQIQYMDQSGREVNITHEMSGNTFAALCKWATIPEPLPEVDKSALKNGELRRRKKAEAEHNQVRMNVLEGIQTCAETFLKDSLAGIDDDTRRRIIEKFIFSVQESPYTARIMNQERHPRNIDI